jgi:hypothetical protein
VKNARFKSYLLKYAKHFRYEKFVNAKANQISLFRGLEKLIKYTGAEGFEPANGGTKNRSLTTWRRPI